MAAARVRDAAAACAPPAARTRASGRSTASSGRSRGRSRARAGRRAAGPRAGRAPRGRTRAGSRGSRRGRCGARRSCRSRRGWRRSSPSSTSPSRRRICSMPSAFEAVGADVSTSWPAKTSAILPTPWTWWPAARRRARWFGRGGASEKSWRLAVRRVGAARADEGPRDDAPDGVRAAQLLARDAAGGVQLVERDDLLVRGDLEDGVGRRVDDPLARPHVLVAEALDDLGARGRHVAEHAAAGRLARTRRRTSGGKPSGYVGMGSGVTMPISSQWPMVVSLPAERVRQAADHGRRRVGGRAARERHARCRARAPGGSAARGRRRPRRRWPGWTIRRRRTPRRPAARRPRRRRGRSRRRAASGDRSQAFATGESEAPTARQVVPVSRLRA